MMVKHPSSRHSSTKSQHSEKNHNMNKMNEAIVSLAWKNSEKQLLKNIIINNKENEILNKIDLEDMCPDFLTSAEAAELVIRTDTLNEEGASPSSCLISNSSKSSPSPSLTLSSSSSPSSSDTDSYKMLTNADTRVVTSADNYEQQLLKKHKVLTLLEDEHHSHNPHHHVHRHRHVHHHRNYVGHIHLHANDDDNLNDESVDDPDSIVPSSSQFLNYSSSDNSNNKVILNSQCGATSKGTLGLANVNINIFESEEVSKNDHQSITDNKLANKDNLTYYTPLKSNPGSFKNISLSNSLVVHRSTPNLSILDGDNDSVDESLVDLQHQMDEKNKTKSNNNLIRIRDNYPSNLELSTNLSDLQEQMTPMLLNNEVNDRMNENINRTVNAKFILNNVSKMEAISKFSNTNALIINNNNGTKKNYQRFKLIVEGDVNVCKLPNSRNYISKILNSKLLRRWKTHRLVLTDTEIFSSTVSLNFSNFIEHFKVSKAHPVKLLIIFKIKKKTDYMDSSIPYHTIIEISPISKWEPGQKYCLRVATIECHYLIQTNNPYLRDQWIHSITWKVNNQTR